MMNYNLLNGNNFQFHIDEAPYLTFFTQTINLPTLSLGVAETENPFNTIPVPGDHLKYGDLNVTFLVDEDLSGYREIHDWMRGLGFPTTFDEYKDRVTDEILTSRWVKTTSDITVTSMTGMRNKNIRFTFQDAFPTVLTAPALTSVVEGVPVITCQATFTYTHFDVSTVKNS
jgi:hypothetical protein